MMTWVSKNPEAAVALVSLVVAIAGFAAGKFLSGGRLLQRFDALEKTVLNGITSRQDDQEKVIKQCTLLLERIDERCGSREGWIHNVQDEVKDLRHRFEKVL